MGFAITSAWNLATKDIQQTLDGVCKKVSTPICKAPPTSTVSLRYCLGSWVVAWGRVVNVM